MRPVLRADDKRSPRITPQHRLGRRLHPNHTRPLGRIPAPYHRVPERRRPRGRQVVCGVYGRHEQRAHQHAHVHAIKGASIAGKAILGKPTDQDVNHRGQRVKRGVKLWPIGTDTAKGVIYGRLRLAEPGPGYVTISRRMDGDVFDQITSERLVTRYVKGHAKLEWVKPNGKRNEALDGAVYALAAAHYRGIDRWKEGEWAKWESRVQSPDLFAAFACSACHDAIDRRAHMDLDRDYVRLAHLEGVLRTQRVLLNLGIIHIGNAALAGGAEPKPTTRPKPPAPP